MSHSKSCRQAASTTKSPGSDSPRKPGLLSRLNHPNIATVFDFDTDSGRDFLVMEYIVGESLEERLHSGALDEKEVLRLGIQIAEGLVAAHEQGVNHRDIKPGNFRLTSRDRIKILDFGLARLSRPITDTATTDHAITEAHTVMGTVPYMAPEQLMGRAVDERTDIYGAGAVLYEMATGRRPFPETRGPQLIARILNQAPEPPSEVKKSPRAWRGSSSRRWKRKADTAIHRQVSCWTIFKV